MGKSHVSLLTLIQVVLRVESINPPFVYELALPIYWLPCMTTKMLQHHRLQNLPNNLDFWV